MRAQHRYVTEEIGVTLPGQGQHIVTVQVGPLETDEEVLRRLSTQLGTVYNVAGVKYEVVSSVPFRIRKLEAPVVMQDDVRAPESDKVPVSGGPAVGERWRPKDPRRKAAFTVQAVENQHVVTDDGRRIQLSRFSRYERLLS